MAAASLFPLLFLATVSITNAQNNDEGKSPSVQQFLDMKCPDPKHPNFCRPYGSCCGPDEFCSSVLRRCESCFPQHLQNNEDDLLLWCKEFGQFNASVMNSLTCTVACQARFTSSQLYIENKNEGKSLSVQQFLDMKCPDPKHPNFCRPYGSCCRYDEYCSTVSSRCDSCFPQHLQNKEDDLLLWCKDFGQFNASVMNSLTCTVACQARFTSSQLYIENKNGSICSVTWDSVGHVLMYAVAVLNIPSLLLLFCLGHCCWRNYQCEHRFGHKRAVYGQPAENIELGKAAKETGGKDFKEPSKLGAQERPASSTYVVTTDETKLKAVPTQSNQETQPLIDDGLADAMRSNESMDSGVQTETPSRTSEPHSPEGNSIAKKTITSGMGGMIFSPSESTDPVLVTNQTPYQN